MWTCIWYISTIFGGSGGLEATDRLVPAGWQGNPWGPAAVAARRAGRIPPIPETPVMKQWHAWGKAVLHDGDLVFRRGDARLLYGFFPFSKFLANVTNSKFSHTGIVAIEDGEAVVYDMTKAGPRVQPFHVWVLDNVGAFGVKRIKREQSAAANEAVKFCRSVFERQVPFDFDLSIDDRAYYCIELTEKAYRAAGVPLSEPVLLGDMERTAEFPVCMFGFLHLTKLTLDQPVFFPGNERHGIWSSPMLETIYVTPTPPPSVTTSHQNSPARSPQTAARDKPATK